MRFLGQSDLAQLANTLVLAQCIRVVSRRHGQVFRLSATATRPNDRFVSMQMDLRLQLIPQPVVLRAAHVPAEQLNLLNSARSARLIILDWCGEKMTVPAGELLVEVLGGETGAVHLVLHGDDELSQPVVLSFEQIHFGLK